jgi:hypothetical protein
MNSLDRGSISIHTLKLSQHYTVTITKTGHEAGGDGGHRRVLREAALAGNGQQREGAVFDSSLLLCYIDVCSVLLCGV